MLCRETVALCSEIHTKHINTLCGQNVEFFNVESSGTQSNRYALKGYYDERSTANIYSLLWEDIFISVQFIFSHFFIPKLHGLDIPFISFHIRISSCTCLLTYLLHGAESFLRS